VPQVARVTIENAYSGPVDAAWATQRPVQPPGGARWQRPGLTLLRDLASLPAARPVERGWCSCWNLRPNPAGKTRTGTATGCQWSLLTGCHAAWHAENFLMHPFPPPHASCITLGEIVNISRAPICPDSLESWSVAYRSHNQIGARRVWSRSFSEREFANFA